MQPYPSQKIRYKKLKAKQKFSGRQVYLNRVLRKQILKKLYHPRTTQHDFHHFYQNQLGKFVLPNHNMLSFITLDLFSIGYPKMCNLRYQLDNRETCPNDPLNVHIYLIVPLDTIREKYLLLALFASFVQLLRSGYLLTSEFLRNTYLLFSTNFHLLFHLSQLYFQGTLKLIQKSPNQSSIFALQNPVIDRN